MNGMEMKGPYFGCDVYSGGGEGVASVQKVGDTCEVTLPDGTKATLCSEGHRQGFYILSPLRLPLDFERVYPFATTNNAILKLANHGIARAT